MNHNSPAKSEIDAQALMTWEDRKRLVLQVMEAVEGAKYVREYDEYFEKNRYGVDAEELIKNLENLL